METIKKKAFNKRAFISVAMFISGSFLPVSGLMNHLLQYEALTRTRHFWMTVHNISAILFAIFAFVHISLNWRTLQLYIRKMKEISVSREAVAAFFIVMIVVGLFASHVFHVN
jgi:hypothetical protein